MSIYLNTNDTICKLNLLDLGIGSQIIKDMNSGMSKSDILKKLNDSIRRQTLKADDELVVVLKDAKNIIKNWKWKEQ